MATWSNEQELWSLVVRNGLPWFRAFRRAASAAEVDRELGEWAEWSALKAKIQPGDKIWPFTFPTDKRYWGKKRGYVVLRRGEFIGGIVCLSE